LIDAIYRTTLAWADKDQDGDTTPALKDIGWNRTPTLQMPGTRTVGNFRLVHAQLPDGLNAGQINGAVPGPCLGALGNEIPAVYDADGNIISPASREEIIPLSQATLLDYMQDIVDENGVATRPTDLSVMHIYAGNPWNL